MNYMKNSLFVGGNEGINSKDVDLISTCASTNACQSNQDADAAVSAASAYTTTDGVDDRDPTHLEASQASEDVDVQEEHSSSSQRDEGAVTPTPLDTQTRSDQNQQLKQQN